MAFERYQIQGVDKHNDFRARHENTPPIELDRQLCNLAMVRISKTEGDNVLTLIFSRLIF